MKKGPLRRALRVGAVIRTLQTPGTRTDPGLARSEAAPMTTTAVQIQAPAVALREVRKVHGQGGAAVVALDGINVELGRGSFTAIMGPSGSGKSTFLHMAAGLDRPTSGSVS